MKTLIGPFASILSMANLPLRGAIHVGDINVISEGGIVVENGKIAAVGPFGSMTKEVDQVNEVEGELTVLPGFVDCHTHMCWAGSRAHDYERRNSGLTYQEILEQGGGIFDTVENTRQASLDDLKSALKKRVLQHLHNGVTTMEIKSGYGLNFEDEVKMLEAIRLVSNELEVELVPTFLGAHVCPDGFGSKNDYLEFLLESVIPLVLDKALAKRADIFVEKEAFPAEISLPYLMKLKDLGFDLTVHAGQFDPSGCQVAVEVDAISADHLESIGNAEIAALANSSTMAVALPGASIGLGMPFPPARKLLDQGCGLAIASDWNPGSAPMGDLLICAAILGTYEKLNALEIFAGITFRAAHALGKKDIGWISKGNKANMVAFPTNDYREILYHQGAMKPAQVWKNGIRIDDQYHVSNL